MAHGTCRECAREDRHLPGRGLCARCYDARWRSGDWGPYDKLPHAGGRPRVDHTRVSKVCARCETEQALDRFAINRGAPDGRSCYCKPCLRAWTKERADANRLVEPVTEGSQTCKSCHDTKPVVEFYWRADQAKRFTKCIPCVRAEARNHWVSGRSKAQRTKKLADQYGLTDDQYAAMHQAQSGRCAICGAEPSEKRALAVDHDHATGAVRALLCGRCNPALGLFQDDPRLLRLAALYLETHSGQVGA